MNRRHQEGFLELTASAGPACLRHIYLLTGNQADAEDVWQEACLKAYRAWPRVRAADDPAAYLMRIVINTFLTDRRAQSRIAALATFEASQNGDMAPPVDDSVVNALSLERMLANLRPQQRAAVVLRYYGDLPYEQIALVLGIAESSARSLVTRGLVALRGSASQSHEPTTQGVK